MKKYELIQDKTIEFEGRKLYRIRALRDFGTVKAGDIGGYVQSENNLSHEGNCWIYDNATVCGNAYVSDNARVKGNAYMDGNTRMSGNTYMDDNARMTCNARMCGNSRMSDNAHMSGDAYMSDSARMCGNAHMGGDACMSGNAYIEGDSIASHPGHIFTATNVGSEYDTLTIAHGPSGIIVTRGCFIGSVEEFIKQSKEEHDAETVAEYAELIRIGSAIVLRHIEKYPHP